MRRVFRLGVLVAMLGLGAANARAEDNALLIQVLPGGGFLVWHTEGETRLSDEELLQLEAAASAEGSAPTATTAGPARAQRSERGVVVSFAQSSARLLLDRDGCGHIKAWHSEGATRLSEEQITDLVMAAVPGGGPRLRIDERVAKSYLVPLGVAVTLWRPREKRP